VKHNLGALLHQHHNRDGKQRRLHNEKLQSTGCCYASAGDLEIENALD
jgi:hypothetical protein